MLDKLRALLGGPVPAQAASAAPFYRPYAGAEANTHYNLLFCDNPQVFARLVPGRGALTILTAPRPRPAAVAQTLSGVRLDPRAQLLACALLRAAGEPAALGVLGVVLEVQLETGLEALAAYADGQARYLDTSGRLRVGESVAVAAAARGLVDDARQAWPTLPQRSEPRPPPPPAGNVRLSLLAGTAVHCVQGRFAELQQQPQAGALVGQATRVLRELGRHAGV